MLYKLAHILRQRMPWLWDAVERMDAWLFQLRYRSRLKRMPEALAPYRQLTLPAQEDCPMGSGTGTNCRVVLLEGCDAVPLSQFFAHQPDEAFRFFRPHDFDETTLRRLLNRPSFLAFAVVEGELAHQGEEREATGHIVAYFFLRCYAMGKCFRGYMVDIGWRGRGLSKLTDRVMSDVERLLDIPSYGTIAPENAASLRSQRVRILNRLDSGDYYVQYVGALK